MASSHLAIILLGTCKSLLLLVVLAALLIVKIFILMRTRRVMFINMMTMINYGGGQVHPKDVVGHLKSLEGSAAWAKNKKVTIN